MIRNKCSHLLNFHMNLFIEHNFAVLLATAPECDPGQSDMLCINISWLDTLSQIQRCGITMWPIHCPAVRVGSSRRQTGEDMFREGPVLEVQIQQGQKSTCGDLTTKHIMFLHFSKGIVVHQSVNVACTSLVAVELSWFSIRILELFNFTPKVPPNFCFSVYKVKGGICHS